MKNAINAAIILIIATVFSGCAVSEGRAIEAAQRQGMTDVQALGLTAFACSESDMGYGRKVSGVNANGTRVTATVCCGVWKDCTVRY